MDRIAIPEEYEDRLAAARDATAKLPEGPMRDRAVQALSNAPTSERIAAAMEAAARAGAIASQLMGAAFDGTDTGRVVWLRLDYTGRLGSLALSPTVDRMSGKAVAKAVQTAWDVAETARSAHVARAERVGADLLARSGFDLRSADLRERVARSPERFTAGGGEDDVCEAEVTLAGRLTAFRFTVPNVTADTEYERLAAEVSAVIGEAQRGAAERLVALVTAGPR